MIGNGGITGSSRDNIRREVPVIYMRSHWMYSSGTLMRNRHSVLHNENSPQLLDEVLSSCRTSLSYESLV